MKKTLTLLIGLALSQFVTAETLIQVYEQAKETNPELRSAYAEKEKAYSAITESRGSLLPALGLTSSYSISEGTKANKGNNSKTADFYKLTVSQSLFNLAYWESLSIAKKQASIYDIAYQYKNQTVILNTAVNYFNVLKALDALTYTEANRKEIARQLEQTTQKNKVGLVAITDVQNAKANYDLTVATKISAINNLNNAIEDLRQISGRFYSKLASVNTDNFQTEMPTPINFLLKQSESANLDLLKMRLNKDVAKDQITLAEAGHLPTISLTASTSLTNTETYGSAAPASNRDTGSHSVGVSVSLPLFSGGKTLSQVNQAEYNYVSYSEQLENTNRSVINQIRSAHNDILASISSIQAYQQAVMSTQGSLEATKAGYQVGTRTIVDVLTATTSLYNAKKNLSDARYTYLTGLLKLKYYVGVLTADDLVALNNMLGSEVDTIVTANQEYN